VSLSLVAGILGFSASASADWQGTAWGMSSEDAAKSFRIPHRKPRPEEVFDQKAKLVFDAFTTGNIVFEGGVLDLEDGGLVKSGCNLSGPINVIACLRLLVAFTENL
jgi:hypothetical protein